jgi:hypothetical protein
MPLGCENDRGPRPTKTRPVQLRPSAVNGALLADLPAHVWTFAGVCVSGSSVRKAGQFLAVPKVPRVHGLLAAQPRSKHLSF